MEEKFVGIDVSKDRLDVAFHPNTESFSVDHNKAGLAELIERLGNDVALVVVEATGGYERDVLAELISAGIPAALVNPRQVRDFAKAVGRLAKTDSIDAEVLARFAQAVRPRLHEPRSAEIEEIRALWARRKQLVEMLTAERNRRVKATTESVRANLTTHINWLDKQLRDIDRELKKRIEVSEVADLVDLLQTAPGIGPVFSSCAALELPELGKVSHKSIAALVGIAPFNTDSGRFSGERRVWGGRASVRAALYMGALVATRHNPVIREIYQRLRAKGKPAKVALVACMRKLLTILNAMARDRKPWSPQLAQGC